MTGQRAPDPADGVDQFRSHRSGYDARTADLIDRMRRRPSDLRWDQVRLLIQHIDRLEGREG